MTVPHDEPHVKSDAEATEEATLPLDGGNIYVRQDGPRDAPALLLIHGSGSSTRTWDPMVPLLTTSHRVIRLDLLGHVIVVGHSSGGYTATALAEQRPGVVTALALRRTPPSLYRDLRRAGGPDDTMSPTPAETATTRPVQVPVANSVVQRGQFIGLHADMPFIGPH